MKKLILIIGILAIVIVLISAVLALLSVLKILPIIVETPVAPNGTSSDQVTILFAQVDSLVDQKFRVEEVWLAYFVVSRFDTAVVESANPINLTGDRLTGQVTERKLVRYMEKTENTEIDYVFLVDDIGRELINDLLEPQQSSIKMNGSMFFCEILLPNKVQLFDFLVENLHPHVRTTIPESFLEQFANDENLENSFYCESIEP